MAKKRIERCSCEESEHQRKALRAIGVIAGEVTPFILVNELLAQISNLASQALKLEELDGDPALGSVRAFVKKRGVVL